MQGIRQSCEASGAARSRRGHRRRAGLVEERESGRAPGPRPPRRGGRDRRHRSRRCLRDHRVQPPRIRGPLEARRHGPGARTGRRRPRRSAPPGRAQPQVGAATACDDGGSGGCASSDAPASGSTFAKGALSGSRRRTYYRRVMAWIESPLPAGLVAAAVTWLVALVVWMGPSPAHPRPADERSSHVRPTPRLGGIGIVCRVLAGAALSLPGVGAPAAPGLWLGLMSALALAAVSLLDNLRSLPADAAPGLPRGGRRGHRRRARRLGARAGRGRRGLVRGGTFAVAAGTLDRRLRQRLQLHGRHRRHRRRTGARSRASAGRSSARPSATPESSRMGTVVAGASAGFLCSNSVAARLFIGDVGSAFLGYLLAVLPFLGAGSPAGPRLPALLLGGPSCSTRHSRWSGARAGASELTEAAPSHRRAPRRGFGGRAATHGQGGRRLHGTRRRRRADGLGRGGRHGRGPVAGLLAGAVWRSRRGGRSWRGGGCVGRRDAREPGEDSAVRRPPGRPTGPGCGPACRRCRDEIVDGLRQRRPSAITSVFVPWSIVTGRSVLSRSVKQGRRGPSSLPGCRPSRSAPGGVVHQRQEVQVAERVDEPQPVAVRRLEALLLERRAVRGWTGKTIGRCAAHRARSALDEQPRRRAGSSTLAGRCSVSTA